MEANQYLGGWSAKFDTPKVSQYPSSTTHQMPLHQFLVDETFNKTLTTIPEICPLRNEIQGLEFKNLARQEPGGKYDALAI